MPDGMDPDDRDLAESMHDFEAAVSAGASISSLRH